MIGRLLLTRHSLIWKKIKNIAIVDQMHSFGIKSYEVRAELAILAAFAGFDAEQIRIGTISTFAQRNTDFGNGDMTGVTYGEEILTFSIILAARQILVIFNKAKYSTTHENVRMSTMISLDLFEAFICPIDTSPTINHNAVNIVMSVKKDDLLGFRGKWLI